MIDPRPILDGDRDDDLDDYSSAEWHAVARRLDALATTNETRVETLIRLVQAATPRRRGRPRKGKAQRAAAAHRDSSAAYRATQHARADSRKMHAPRIFCHCGTPAGAINRQFGGIYVVVCQTCGYVVPEESPDA
jgi:hypothetical protein